MEWFWQILALLSLADVCQISNPEKCNLFIRGDRKTEIDQDGAFEDAVTDFPKLMITFHTRY